MDTTAYLLTNNQGFLQEVITILLNGVSPVYFIAYYFIGAWGVVLSKAQTIYSLREDIKESPYTYWKGVGAILAKQVVKLIIAFLALPTFIVFSEQLLGAKMTAQLALLTGYGIDKAFENFGKKPTI